MKEITWTEALIGNVKLKQIREKENIIIPDAYINSSRKMAFSLGIWMFALGTVLGLVIMNVIN